MVVALLNGYKYTKQMLPMTCVLFLIFLAVLSFVLKKSGTKQDSKKYQKSIFTTR